MSVMLNPMLIKLQNLDTAALKKLAELHTRKDDLFTIAEQWNRDNNLKRLLKGAKELEQIEFAMQRAWKFEEDSNKHTWKILYPGCTCPGPIDQPPYPNYTRVSSSCKVHKER